MHNLHPFYQESNVTPAHLFLQQDVKNVMSLHEITVQPTAVPWLEVHLLQLGGFRWWEGITTASIGAVEAQASTQGCVSSAAAVGRSAAAFLSACLTKSSHSAEKGDPSGFGCLNCALRLTSCGSL
jgi:hypothetical protein